MSTKKTISTCLTLLAAATAALASSARAAAPPIGSLPPGPSSTIATTTGELVAVALPHRAGGRAWRIAKAPDAKVLRQISEADVGNQVVLVFKAAGQGTTTFALALTRGERATAYESRRYTVTVRS
jgi:hypothetical protein